MLIKTRELTGAALDWAVAVANNKKPVLTSDMRVNGLPAMFADDEDDLWCPSTNWGQGGPLIDEYKIKVWYPFNCCVAKANAVGEVATAFSDVMSGETTLEAICRAVVYHCIGEEVEIPNELIHEPVLK